MSAPHRPAAAGLGPALERWLEAGLFGSRWLMAPFYVGLIVALPILLWVFAADIVHEAPKLFIRSPRFEDGVLLVLSLIDLTLAANLVLIVVFSGYESFVSKIETAGHKDRPDWMGKVDFSSLKLKLIASIVAISAISLLKTFMLLGSVPVAQETLIWQVVIHLTFVASGVFLALMDWLHCMAEKTEAEAHAVKH
ncbi:MAG TPA: TIGR00645 family protein [Caulobacteraceae bacterium]